MVNKRQNKENSVPQTMADALKAVPTEVLSVLLESFTDKAFYAKAESLLRAEIASRPPEVSKSLAACAKAVPSTDKFPQGNGNENIL